MLQNAENMHYSSTEEEEGYSSYTDEEDDEFSLEELSLESQGDSSSISSLPIAIPNHT